MNDLISRQAVIDLIDEYMDNCIELHYLPTGEGIKALIFALPSAQPTIDPVKKGKWIKTEGSLWNMANCSECGEMCVLGDTAKFCPFCGATMVGVITKKRGRR